MPEAPTIEDFLAKYGKRSYVQNLSPAQRTSANFVLPFLNQAVKTAENNPRNFGVLSVKTKDPNKILNNSIVNNFARWLEAGQPIPFVDFMQRRWAPIGVKNDPNNLNKNWAPNVKDALEKMLGPEEYKRWKRYNMVKASNLYRG